MPMQPSRYCASSSCPVRVASGYCTTDQRPSGWSASEQATNITVSRLFEETGLSGKLSWGEVGRHRGRA